MPRWGKENKLWQMRVSDGLTRLGCWGLRSLLAGLEKGSAKGVRGSRPTLR